MAKVKVYNIWLSEVSLRGRKTCPTCKIRLDPSNSVVSIGNYTCGIYRYYFYACRECYIDKINEAYIKGVYKLCTRTGCTVRWLTGDETITVER